MYLHKVRNKLGSFFAVAEWKSQAERDAMVADTSKGESELSKHWQKFAKNDEFGEIIRFAGEELGTVLPKE